MVRLMFKINDEEAFTIEAASVPMVGDLLLFSTPDFEGSFDGSLVVQSVEHQTDRSSAEQHDSHDVCLICRRA